MLVFSGTALAQPATWNPSNFSSSFTLRAIVENLDSPVGIVDPGDGSERLFIVEQPGKILLLKSGALSPEPFLDISSSVSNGSEQGLLGLAFHPDYANTGIFVIDYTDVDGNTNIVRYQVDAQNPDLADPASAETLLFIDQPYPNHNGGQLQFGPDGFLYIGMGDGGSQGDPNENGQNTNALLGKILRIDVDNPTGDLPYGIPADNPFADGSAGAPEVFIYGVRNPWRFSFDADGALYIGDVGQNSWEEIDYLPAGGRAGANLGWNLMEGTHCYATDPCDSDNLVKPVFEYSHDVGGCSVTGGVVIQGDIIPSLDGVYVFGDYCTGLLWGLARDANGDWQASDPIETGLSISSFGQGPDGETYVVDLNGAIYQMVAA
jgi:glucose/arabinose dehydrogenase